MDIHWIDITIICILLASFGFSCWKGLIKEAFALGSLFISFLIANQFHSMLAPYLKGIFSTKLISEVGAFILIFVVSVIILRLLGKLIREKFVSESSTLTFIDRTGGGILGLIKGLIILILILIPIMNIPPVKDYVYDNSELTPYIENSAAILTSITTGESLVKKVRDDNTGFLSGIREKTRKAYKKVEKSVTSTAKKVAETKAVEAIKEKSKELTSNVTSNAAEHKDAITEKDQTELDKMLDKIAE